MLTPMNSDPQTELARLAAMVRQLRPSFRDAEGFYELRSEVTGGLMALSRRLGVPAPVPMPSPRVTAPVTPMPKPRIVVVRGFPGTCRRCQRRFEAVQPTKRYCSHACRQSDYRQRLRAKAAKPAPGAPAAGSVPEHPGSV
jgi:hypothetical protein